MVMAFSPLRKISSGRRWSQVLSSRCPTELSRQRSQVTLRFTLTRWAALSFELSLDVNRIVRRYLGTNAIKPYAYAQKGTMSDANTLTLSCDENATTKAILDAMLAGTTVGKLIRLKATSGTNVIQLDFAGELMGAPVPFTDQDGIRTLDLKFQAIQDSGSFGN